MIVLTAVLGTLVLVLGAGVTVLLVAPTDTLLGRLLLTAFGVAATSLVTVGVRQMRQYRREHQGFDDGTRGSPQDDAPPS